LGAPGGERWTAGQSPIELKETVEERRRCVGDADDLVRGLTVEFEVELRLGSAVIPVGEWFEFAPSLRPLCECGASDDDADTRGLPGDAALPGDRLGGRDTPRAKRPCPPSVSLANTNTTSPSAMWLPPYIVFCAGNVNVFARGSRISALTANGMLPLASHMGRTI
jgi:hypothetical protein